MEQRGAVEEMERRRPTATHHHRRKYYFSHDHPPTHSTPNIRYHGGSWNLEVGTLCALDLNRILAVIEGPKSLV